MRVAALSTRGTPGAALLVCSGLSAAMLLVTSRSALLASRAVVLVLVPYIALSVAIWRTARATRPAGAAGALSTGLVPVLSLFTAVGAAG